MKTIIKEFKKMNKEDWFACSLMAVAIATMYVSICIFG